MAWSGPARSFKLRSVHLEFAEEQSFCALWRVLDENASGFVDPGELGRFMRLAESNQG